MRRLCVIGVVIREAAFPLWSGSVNVVSLIEKDVEVVSTAVEGRLDFCSPQETRWRGESARKMGAYKLLSMGCEKGIHDVEMLVADKWIGKALDVKRVSARLMLVRVIVGRSVLNVISVYAPQTGWSEVEKVEFLAML